MVKKAKSLGSSPALVTANAKSTIAGFADVVVIADFWRCFRLRGKGLIFRRV
ncbi:MAG: hypothetical protein LBJ46_11360 [Planctomycetota bacterium]|jgi:hypothetical protein|nr:hypothetical protein [Planctomycetota bacterium]